MARDLSRLLYPKSIAFIGGSECDLAIRRTVEFGFKGPLYAVHPKRDQLGGMPTLRSVSEIKGPIDSAFIAVQREATIDVVRSLRALGCGGAVIYASGFAETGDERLQDALLHAADGMPLLGPNCYGYINGLARAALWPDEHGVELLDRGVAIVTQSGNIACNLAMTRRALPLATVITAGNMADVGMAELVEALAADARITAIGLHIEGINDVQKFAHAAAFARDQKKPVVVLKTGRSEQGAKVALSHTSSLAGADTLYDALFQRFGIARVHSVTAFVETLKFLHHGGPLNDSRLVSMSCSGGEAALIADMAIGHGVSFPPFDALTKSKVAATLNDYVSIDNPLDYHTFIWRQEDKLRATFSAVLSGGFDTSILLLDVPNLPHMNPEAWVTTARALQSAANTTSARAVIVATLPECMPVDLSETLAENGIAAMLGLDDALTAIAAAAKIGRNWNEPDERPSLKPAVVGEGTVTALNEFDAKTLLKSFGLVVPEGRICTAVEAASVADQIGYPVTLKVSSPNISHKTEVGGVVLNLRNRDEVARSAEKLGQLAPDLLVEKMVTGAVAELIVGLKSDPQFGLALVIGAGGIFTELLRDSVSLLLPTNRHEITRALTSLKIWRLVEGYRGKSGDTAAVIEAIESVANFADRHHGQIEELDINPLLVLPDGVIAVDALLKMRMP